MITTPNLQTNYAAHKLLVLGANQCTTSTLSTELRCWNSLPVNGWGQLWHNKSGSDLGKDHDIHNPQPLLELSRVKQLNKYIESGNQVEVPM